MSRGPIAAVAVVMTLVCVVSAAQDRGGGGTAAPPVYTRLRAQHRIRRPYCECRFACGVVPPVIVF